MSAPDVCLIVPVEGGRLMVVRASDFAPVLGDRDFPDGAVAAAALGELAAACGETVRVLRRPDGKVDRVLVGRDCEAD